MKCDKGDCTARLNCKQTRYLPNGDRRRMYKCPACGQLQHTVESRTQVFVNGTQRSTEELDFKTRLIQAIKDFK